MSQTRIFVTQVFLTALLLALAGCDSATISGPEKSVSPAEDLPVAAPQDPVSNPLAVPAADDEVSPDTSTSDVQNPNIEDSVEPEPVVESQPEPAPAPPQPAEPRVYSAADITDLILVTGQSNALGADTEFDPALDGTSERVFAFTEEGWRRADLHQVWDLGWFPRGNPGGEPSNNLALHFGKQITSQRSDRVVGFVLVAAPGKGIEHWDTGGAFFSSIDQKVLNAINQAPQKSSIDGILWHQGENDEGDFQYGEKLNRVIANFRQQSWFAADRPFICGETAVFEVVNRQLMALNNDGDRWTGCVDSDGLDTREDGFHFNAGGLRELGWRYATKYLSLQR